MFSYIHWVWKILKSNTIWPFHSFTLDFHGKPWFMQGHQKNDKQWRLVLGLGLNKTYVEKNVNILSLGRKGGIIMLSNRLKNLMKNCYKCIMQRMKNYLTEPDIWDMLRCKLLPNYFSFNFLMGTRKSRQWRQYIGDKHF